MKRITTFETSDGKIHRTQKEAERHAENRMGAAIDQLAYRLCDITKMQEMRSFLEQHAEELAGILPLKKDLELENPEEDDRDE